MLTPNPDEPEPNRSMMSSQKIEVGHTLKTKMRQPFCFSTRQEPVPGHRSPLLFFDDLTHNFIAKELPWVNIDTFAGRGAVWLARLTGGQEVAGSSPVAPMGTPADGQRHSYLDPAHHPLPSCLIRLQYRDGSGKMAASLEKGLSCNREDRTCLKPADASFSKPLP